MATGIETQRRLCLYPPYVLTEAPPVTVMDALSLTWQQGVGGGSVLSLSGLSSITERHRTVRPYPAARAVHPPPHSFPLNTPLVAACHMTYRSTCLASPLLPNHYDTLRAAAAGSGFQWRVEVGRKEHWGGLMGKEKVAKPAIRLHFQGGKKSHHWLNHIIYIVYIQYKVISAVSLNEEIYFSKVFMSCVIPNVWM